MVINAPAAGLAIISFTSLLKTIYLFNALFIQALIYVAEAFLTQVAVLIFQVTILRHSSFFIVVLCVLHLF
jgi:hypothetical protein